MDFKKASRKFLNIPQKSTNDNVVYCLYHTSEKGFFEVDREVMFWRFVLVLRKLVPSEEIRVTQSGNSHIYIIVTRHKIVTWMENIHR
jgi:hypothetical protein